MPKYAKTFHGKKMTVKLEADCMTNWTVALIYTALLIITLILLFASFLNRKKSRYISRCAVLYALISGWLICQLAFHAVKNEFAVAYIHDLKLIFVSFSAYAVFMVVATF